jgi:hypothetical protein
MPAAGDLDGLRCAVTSAFSVVAGPVPADDPRAGMRCQPRLQRGGLPVRQQVDHVPCAHVHQHRPVHLALGQREVINPEHLRCRRDLRIRRRGDQAQHRGRVHGDPEGPGQPGRGAAGQLQPEPGPGPGRRRSWPAGSGYPPCPHPPDQPPPSPRPGKEAAPGAVGAGAPEHIGPSATPAAMQTRHHRRKPGTTQSVTSLAPPLNR